MADGQQADADERERLSGLRIPELDGLRGIAILLVIAYHYLYFSPSPNYRPTGLAAALYWRLQEAIGAGWSGVDLFFLLSGFLIGGILLDVRTSPRYFKTFYLRRAYRIIPIYYAWILSYFVAMALAGPILEAHLPGAPVSGHAQYAALFLFLQNSWNFHYSEVAGKWFGPTWSLAVEEQFYLVVPLLIRFLSRRILYIVLSAIICIAPLFRIFVHYHGIILGSFGFPLSYMLTPSRADALALGVLAALFWRNETFRSWLSAHIHFLYILVSLFLAGIVVIAQWSPSPDSIPMQFGGYTWFDIFYWLILFLVLARTSGLIAWFARRKWLREVGRVSYCIYLIHQMVGIVIGIIAVAFLKHVKGWEGVLISGLSALVSYVIARISWIYFEHPLLRRGHTFEYFPDTPAVVPGVLPVSSP